MLKAKTRDGSTIAYRIDSAVAPWEQPAATLLMHHGVGFDGTAWSQWLPALLQARLRVIRVDMRGHGQSSVPPIGYRWETETFCADVTSVLDAEQVASCHFIGESWGGTIGLTMAAAFPERIRTLSVISTAFDGSTIPHIADYPELIRRAGIKAWSDAMMGARFHESAPSAIVDWAARMQEQCAPHVIADIFQYICGASIADRLSDIRAPVLIMAPQESPFVAQRMASDLRDRLPDAELLRFPGHRHGLVLSGAKPGAAALLNFIERRT